MSSSPPDLASGFAPSAILRKGDDIMFPVNALTGRNPAKDIGSTWVYTYNGALWPVVLCGVDGLPEGFLASRRGEHELPAILLGRHRYIWVLNDMLREFNPNFDYLKGVQPFEQPDIVSEDDDSTKVEKQRRAAFRQDAMHFESPEFWHNYIRNKSEARRVEAKMNAQEIQQRINSTPKRKRSDDSSSSSSRYDRIQKQRERRREQRTMSMDARQYLTPKSSGKKPSSNLFGAAYAHLFSNEDGEEVGEEYEGDGGNMLFVPNQSDDVFREERRPRKAARRDNGPPPFVPPEMGPDMCRILVGHNPRGVIVPIASLMTCDYLLQRQTIQDDEYLIDLRTDPDAVRLQLTEAELTRIYEYFHTGKMEPHWPKILNRNEKTAHAQTLGYAFLTAGKIQHEELEEHIKSKLMAMHPLPANAILILAKIVGRLRIGKDNTKAERWVRDWIVDCVANQFWELARSDNQQLQRLMKDHRELRKTVLEKVEEDLETGDMRIGA